MKLLTTLAAITIMLAASSLAADGPIRHVVHFRFKPGAAQDQVQKVVDDFAALRTRIPLIESLEYGTNISPEGLDQGFTHCWIVSFKNAADRDAYLVHPDHKAFAAGLKTVLDAALVVDFVSKSAPAK